MIFTQHIKPSLFAPTYQGFRQAGHVWQFWVETSPALGLIYTLYKEYHMTLKTALTWSILIAAIFFTLLLLFKSWMKHRDEVRLEKKIADLCRFDPPK